jgi:hypothetical protein
LGAVVFFYDVRSLPLFEVYLALAFSVQIAYFEEVEAIVLGGLEGGLCFVVFEEETDSARFALTFEVMLKFFDLGKLAIGHEVFICRPEVRNFLFLRWFGMHLVLKTQKL